MSFSIVPDFWEPNWLSKHKRLRPILYPTSAEKEEKKRKYDEAQQKKKEEEINTRKENEIKFNIWFNKQLSNYKPTYQSRSHSAHFLIDNSLQQLRNKLSRKFKICIPKIDIDTNQVTYLMDMLKKEEEEIASQKFMEKLKSEREERDKQIARDRIYRQEKIAEKKEWVKWYKNALQINLSPTHYKNDLSAKKAQKRDIGKMRKMWFFRYIFDNFYSLQEFSNLDNERLVHLYRVKMEEDKVKLKKQQIQKVKTFLESEKTLENKCIENGITYIKYEKLPGKQWTKSKKWNIWVEANDKRLKLINEKIEEAIKYQQWNKLTTLEKQEIFDFRKKWLVLEQEKLKTIRLPQQRRAYISPQNEFIYSDTGHSLQIDPNWDSEKRREEIQQFNQAIRDF